MSRDGHARPGDASDVSRGGCAVSTVELGPGDVVLPALDVDQLQLLLDQIDAAQDDPSVDREVYIGHALVLAGYLRAALRSAQRPGGDTKSFR